LISFKPNENLSPKRLKSVKRTINETVISTIYTIFLSVIQLILILVLSVFDNYYVVIGLSFLIYSLLAHIFVVFLMILKRIYILYDSNS
jgi:magnesium-transporting ATPase (P-type)